MHDRLFANQKTLDQWNTHAEAIGLDVTAFQACMDSGKEDKQIRADMAEARKAGITGTPAFFLAYTDSKSDKVKTVTRLIGAKPYASFKEAIDQLLAKAAETGKDKK